MPHVANEVAPADLGTILLIQAIVVSRLMAWLTVDSLLPSDCPSCQSDVVVETIATSKLGYIFISCLQYPGIFIRSKDISYSVKSSSFQFMEDFPGLKTPASLQPRKQRCVTISMIQVTAAKQMWGYVIVKKPRPQSSIPKVMRMVKHKYQRKLTALTIE